MQDKLIELHQQRGRLLERISAQRVVLSHQLVPLQGALNVSDRAAGLVQDAKAFIRKYPIGVALTVAAVVLLKPRTALRFARHGMSAWRTWRGLRSYVPGFMLTRLRNLLWP